MKMFILMIIVVIYLILSIPLLIFGLLYSAWMADISGFKALWSDITVGKFYDLWENDVFH